MPRILLYSDQPVLAVGLQSVLRTAVGLELVSVCSTVETLIARLATEPTDIALLDLTSEITFGVLTELKRSADQCKIVLWVNSISTELAFQAMGLGVRGILRKTLPAELQVKCLLKVHGGELWFEKALTDSFLSARRVALTQREGQLVSLLSQGLKNKEIATALVISEGTVKVYLSRLFQKVGVKDRFELALFGLKNLTTAQGPALDRSVHPGSERVAGLRSLVLESPSGKPAVPFPSYDTPRRLVAVRQTN
jgi:DNA-binding NarL/FixJ family response regulator